MIAVTLSLPNRSFDMKAKITILLLAFMSLVSSCSLNEEQAENSIEGKWEVKKITSIYGKFNGGFSGDETITQEGILGEFNFSESLVDFEFTRNDTLFSGMSTWNLTSERVNEGFVKVTKFKLAIEDYFNFDCVFGDETKNSEKNATNMTLMRYPEGQEYGVFIQLELEKKI